MDDLLDGFNPYERELIQIEMENNWLSAEQKVEQFIPENVDFDPLSSTALSAQKSTYYGLVAADFLRPGLKSAKTAFRSLKPVVDIGKTTGIRGWKVGDSIRNFQRVSIFLAGISDE